MRTIHHSKRYIYFTFISFITNTPIRIYDRTSLVVCALILWSVKHVNCRNGRHSTFIPFKLIHLPPSISPFLPFSRSFALTRTFLCAHVFMFTFVDGPQKRTNTQNRNEISICTKLTKQMRICVKDSAMMGKNVDTQKDVEESETQVVSKTM